MDNRVTVYTVLAVMVGYMLISAVPGQLERYVTPHPVTLTGAEEDLNEETFGEPRESPNATEDTQAFTLEQGVEELSDETDGPKAGDSGIFSYLNLYKWWALDLGLAFSVYWLARHRLG